MTIGQRIKQRRIELNMSQEELAKKMGYSTRNAIYQFEKKDNMKLSLVEKFAKALDVTPGYLMGWEEAAKELQRQTKPLTDFLATHTLNPDFQSIIEQYEPAEVFHAFIFAKAFLASTPERQKIALEILRGQPHQEDS